MKKNDCCYYPHRSIGTMKSLALHLGIPLDALKIISENAHQYYTANKPMVKENGAIRVTYSVNGPLKTLQDKIKNNLLKKVHYPDYLQGSLTGRSPITNSKKHLGAAIIIKEDIKNFFDSIPYERVLIMWKHLFCFPDDVAHCLAKLTTFKGFLGQGCSTSSYLANLIFWEIEPKIVSALSRKGIIYTRYVDDITLSSKSTLSKKQITACIRQVYYMLQLNGLKLNYSKHKIITKINRLSVNNININGSKITIPKWYRKNIRVAMKRYEEVLHDINLKNQLYLTIMGRLSYIKYCHPDFVNKCTAHIKISHSLHSPQDNYYRD